MSAALLFDLDGTLAESDGVHRAVFVEQLADYGVAVDEELFAKRIHGRSNAHIFPDLLPGRAEAEYRAIADEKERRFRVKVGELGVSPVPGLPALLDAATPATPVACVTNAPRLNAETLLRAIGLESLFPGDRLVIGEECAEPKPSPVPYQVAMRAVGVEPARCVVFEDSASGIRAGVAAGAGCVVGVRTQASEEALLQAGATFTVATFAEAVAPLRERGFL